MKSGFTKIAGTSLLLLIVLGFLLAYRHAKSPAATDGVGGVQSKTRPGQEYSLAEQNSNSRSWTRTMSDPATPDIGRMIASLKGMDNGPQYQFKLRQIAALYAEIDPGKGFEWLNSLPPDMASVPAFSSFFALLGQTDPARAIKWVEQIEFEGGQKAAASSAATIIAYHNASQGWDLLDRWKSIIPDRATMQGRLLQSISHGSGAEVAWNIYNPKNQNLTMEDTKSFFKAVRFPSPKDAFDFAADRVAPDHQSVAIEAIVRNWTPTGLKIVSEELAARPVQSKYDRAYAALSGRILTSDPISAAQWSNIISDPDLKNTVRKQIRDFARINDKAILDQVNDVIGNQ